jgi:crotonobetainyl-CoA:carnitine CoA-transferase CaiB-like acyl-CoA transferase
LVPYQVLASANGHVIVAAGNDSQWQRFCVALERPDLATDARYTTGTGRIVNRETLVPELEHVMLKRTTEEWLERLEVNGIPAGPINSYEQVFADPQVKHRELWVDMPQKNGGVMPTIASPLRMSDTPVEYRMPAPTLGQHTSEILGSVLGKTREELDRMIEQRIISI